MDKLYIDHFLLGAVRDAIGMPGVPYDLKRIKKLDKFNRPVDTYFVNVSSWLTVKAGAFEILAEMPNLHTLLIAPPSAFYSQLHINDFSFLKQCKKLKKLDLTATNFSDCRLLLELPALQMVSLPPLWQLTHTEVLAAPELVDKVRISAREPVEVRMLTPPEPEPMKFVPLKPGETYEEVFPPKPDWKANAAAQPASPAQPQSAPVLLKREPAQPLKKEPSEMIKKLTELYKERTGVPAFRLTVQPDLKPTLFDTKLGGFPYWDLSKPVPAGPNGRPMMLLAQINLDRAKTAPPLPARGMLQFFIAQDDDYFGCDFGEGDGSGFQIVYHETIDEAVTLEQVQALGFVDSTGEDYLIYSPVCTEVVLKIEESTSYLPLISEKSDKIIEEIALSLGVDFGGKSFYQALGKGDNDYLWDQLSGGRHWMLGHPYFTQTDPREPDSPYDTLLLEIDTDGADRVNYVMWGDAGIANFFINRKKLEQLDFSDVLYTWDCC